MPSLRLPLPLFVMGAVFLLRAPMIAGSGITDPDFYWHLAYGDWILAHWQAFMERTRPDVVLIERNQPLHQLLLANGRFRSTFDDGRWAVLLHQTPDARL